MRTYAIFAALIGCAFVVGFTTGRTTAAAEGPIKTTIASKDGTERVKNPWGNLRKYHTGETYGVKDLLVAELQLEPGKMIHAAHQHPEEEFLILTKGKGTWILNGEEKPAEKGDVVYVAPWDMHTFRAAENKKMEVIVLKWGYKGLENPAKPE